MPSFGRTAPPASPGPSQLPTASTAPNSITSHTSFETSWRTTPLSNGNYVVAIPGWNNGPIANAGAVVWADGTTGITGPVTTTNSLHGTSAGDSVGGRRELWDPGTVTPLSNGNYIVGSPSWNNGSVVDAGAATLADGATGTTGPVTTTNSLHGTTAGDQVGTEVTPLANGNYVVQTPGWDHGPIVDAGAATWADGTTGITGPVTTTNSLHGTTTEAHVGYAAIGLVNGNYIIWSPFWDHGSIPDAGAVTWADGTTGITGPVTTANSLHGTSTEKRVGRSFRRLDNGGYVVTSPTWGDDNEGAITYGSPHRGVVGPVTPSNSLIDYRAGAKPSSTSPKIRLTSGNAVLVGTGADRAWLLLLDPRPDGVTTVAPARLLETRDHPDYTTTDNRFRATGPLTAGTEIALDVAGRGGIPTNATAAFLNITAILPDAPGHLTIYPCGTRRPTTSTLNYQPGDVIANNVLAPIGTNGRVCIHTHATTHIITDTTGYDPG
ncbi:hypothetical protein [Ilumatobacter sp.]|uniref:hypothetical protein n=1 Tax=Ilumatobacter sp. TaxID=1967498 RepID=UPI003AF88D51